MYQETETEGNGISLENVTQSGNQTITTSIYLNLDTHSAAKTDYIQDGDAFAIGDTFGTITKIAYQEN